jgi:hypothetical protein
MLYNEPTLKGGAMIRKRQSAMVGVVVVTVRVVTLFGLVFGVFYLALSVPL